MRAYFQIRREIEIDAGCPVRDREEVSIRNREVASQQVFLIGQMLFEVSIARIKAATDTSLD